MADASGEWLAGMVVLRRRVRAARRGCWLPLLLFGVLGLIVAPLYVGSPTSGSRSGWAARLLLVGGVFTGHPRAIALVWLLGIPVVCLATAVYYRRRSLHVGVRGRVWPFAVVALALDAVLLTLGARAVPLALHGLLGYLVVAAGIGALAVLERSPGLGLFTVGFTGLVVAVNLYDTENLLFRLGVPYNAWSGGLPNPLLPAVALLAAAAVAAGREG